MANFSDKRIGLIWAQGDNREIGLNGKLPWSIPEDLAFFNRVTNGSTVIMGRRTWESLPVKPLPGRRNIVVSSKDIPGVIAAESIEEAVMLATDTIWVMGGAKIYEAFLPFADRILITHVDGSFNADTYAPELGDNWARPKATSWLKSTGGQAYRVSIYERL